MQNIKNKRRTTLIQAACKAKASEEFPIQWTDSGRVKEAGRSHRQHR